MLRQNRKNKKVIIGLTGSFGSGKSSVARILVSCGARIIDADKLAHKSINPGGKSYRRVISVFGKSILKKDKTIDRRKLSGVVFNNESLLERLNKIIHPEVIRMINNEIKKAKANFIVLDAPLLIEAGLKGIVDKLIVVKATQELQIRRIKKRSSLTREEILKRIKYQISLRVKARLADFIIDNSNSLRQTRIQVERVWRSLTGLTRPPLARDL